MRITIDGKPVAIKEGSTFEYIAENRLFSGADGYTLTIELPLAGCPENLAVFGNITRKDVAKRIEPLPCVIQAGAMTLNGAVAVTEIGDSGVKVQFLEGRSVQNYRDDVDEQFINELALPDWPSGPVAPFDAVYGQRVVKAYAFPWVNDYSGNIQNEMLPATFSTLTGQGWKWAEGIDSSSLSWMANLLWLSEEICKAIGYDYDFEVWRSSELSALLCCNTVPTAWDEPNFAVSLPRWTVAEYFEKLELFLGAEIELDHVGKRVSMRFTAPEVDNAGTVILEKVLDDYTVEVDADATDADYIVNRGLKYKESSHTMQPFYACPDIEKIWRSRGGKSFSSISGFMDYYNQDSVKYASYWQSPDGFAFLSGEGVYYVADIDTFFVFRRESTTWEEREALRLKGMGAVKYKVVPVAVDCFGGSRAAMGDDDDNRAELDFVPVCIDETDWTHGPMMFLPLSAKDGEEDESDESWVDPSNPLYNEGQTRSVECVQPVPLRMVKASSGESSKREYYDRIFVALWPGAQSYVPPEGFRGVCPRPFLDNLAINGGFYWRPTSAAGFTLRLNKFSCLKELPDIDPTQKFTFKFLSDHLPSPRSIFIIKGKRYICEQLKATFNARGMSEMVTGTFYPLAQ